MVYQPSVLIFAESIRRQLANVFSFDPRRATALLHSIPIC
jgi:hypothetical protein